MPNQKNVVKIHCPSCGQKMDVTDFSPFDHIDCPVCGTDIIVPQVFAGITLEEPMAEGAHVTVYRALDPTLDREVAVKALGEDDPRANRFLSEARRAAAITHANVAPIYSCGIEQNRAYLVMQFLPGGDLAQWLAKTMVGGNPRFALKCGLALARALSAARRQELIHGHVVPTNVLLDVEGNIKLSDFGLATSLDPEHAWQLDEYAYAAPEVLAGAPVDWRADLFSVGAITHQLLTGHLPAVGFSSDEIRRSRLAGELPPEPSRQTAGLPPGLSDLVMSLQAFRPEDRPSGYEEVIGAFRAFEQKVTRHLAHRTSPVHPMPHADPEAQPEPEPLPSHTPNQPDAGSDRLYRTPGKPDVSTLVNWALIVAGVVLLALLCVYALTHGRGTPAPTPEPNPTKATVPAPAVANTGQDTPNAPEPASLPTIPTERRPRPEGLNFAGAQGDLADYLMSLSPTARELESQRLDVVRDIRRQLVKDMEYLPFQSLDAGIELADGRTLKGSIPLASENQLMVRSEGQQIAIRWEDMPFAQCVRLLQFYLVKRMESSDPDLSPALRTKQKNEIGKVCLRNAVLCEWYGKTDLGGEFARLCRAYSPTLLPDLKRLAPETAQAAGL